MDRKKRNFSYKDFSYSNSYNTCFTGSVFYGNNFFKARMKYCGFNGCTFQFIEFNKTNFRGSRFKGAIFRNVWFNNCNLQGASFHGASFFNVLYTNTNISKAKGVPQSECLVRINHNTTKFQLSQQLYEAILSCKSNQFILKSGTLFYKQKNRLSNAKKRALKQMPKADRKEYQRQIQLHIDKKNNLQIHQINLERLLLAYSEKAIIAGLHDASNSINKDFSSLSYFVPYLERATKSGSQRL